MMILRGKRLPASCRPWSLPGTRHQARLASRKMQALLVSIRLSQSLPRYFSTSPFGSRYALALCLRCAEKNSAATLLCPLLALRVTRTSFTTLGGHFTVFSTIKTPSNCRELLVFPIPMFRDFCSRFLGKILTGDPNFTPPLTSHQSHTSAALLPLRSHCRASALLALCAVRGESGAWQSREESASQVLLHRRVDECDSIVVFACRIRRSTEHHQQSFPKSPHPVRWCAVSRANRHTLVAKVVRG